MAIAAAERGFPIPQQAVIQELDQPEAAVDGLGMTARIEKDFEDKIGGTHESAIKFGLSLPAFVIGEFGAMSGNPSFLLLWAPALYFGARAYKKLVEKDEAEKHSIVDDNLGYRADRLVYRGRKLKIGKVELEEGDNLYRLKLAEASCNNGEPSLEQGEAIAKFYARCIREFGEKVLPRDFKAVVVDMGSDFAPQSPLLRDAPQIRRGELFEGKNVHVASPDTLVAVLPRETFEAMSLRLKGIFERAVSALEQSIGRKHNGGRLIQELRRLRLKRGEDLLTEARRLSTELNHLFDSEIEGRFNGLPETFIDKTLIFDSEPEEASNSSPDASVKKRLIPFIRRRSEFHSTFSITRLPNGRFLQQTDWAQGDKRTLLKLDRALDDIIATGLDSKERALLLSYAISQMLQSREFLEEMTQPTELNPDGIVIKLKELGIKIKTASNDRVYPKPNRIAVAVRSAILAAALAGTLAMGGKVAFEAAGLNTSAGPAQIDSNVPMEARPNFGEIKPGLLWKIEDHTKPETSLKANGYYITSTANLYKDGKWVVNNNLENATLLDNKELSKDNDKQSNIVIIGNLILDNSGNANFKLPLRDFSTLYRLRVLDANGNRINPDSYQVYKLEDGTFEVKVFLGSEKASAFIQIREVLIWSDNSVHAIKRIPAIDINKLDKDVLELFNNNGQTQEQLALAVKNNGTYSTNPSNKGILDDLDGSPEDYINTADNLEGRDCDVANTEYALLSTVMDSPKYVNIAFGYSGAVVDDDNPKHLYIDNLSSHAFTITDTGAIIDATPGKVLEDDSKSKQSVENTQEAKGPDLDAAWNQRENDLKKQADKERQREQLMAELQMLGLGIVGVGGLYLVPKGVRTVRRHLTQEKIGSAMSRLNPRRLEKLPPEKLQELYNDIVWILYGGEKHLAPASSVARPQDLSEFLKRVSELNPRAIEASLRNPKVFKKVFGIDISARKLRQLGRLISSYELVTDSQKS